MKTPRVAVYLRVSTTAQDFAAQLGAIEGYLARRGWTKRYSYQEKQSGANAARTALDELMQAARYGLFDVVVIYKLDRLGRSSVHLAQIAQELSDLKIGIISTTEGIDTTAENPMGSFVLKILAAVAELERERIRERAADGTAAALARGVKFGRPKISEKVRAEVLALRGAPLPDGFGHFHFGAPLKTIRAIATQTGVSVGTVAKICAAEGRL